MRKRLAERLPRILVQHAREHLLHDRKRRGLLGDERRHVVEPRLVMLAQLPQPRVQGAKRQAVRRQHQCIGRQLLEPRQRIQIFLHRIGIRLRRRHDHRRRDMRQHLVAGDQDLVLLAVERGVLGRVAAGSDDAPVALAHGDDVAVLDAHEFARRPQAEIFRRTLRSHHRGDVLVRRTIALHVGGELFVRTLLALVPHHPAIQPFGERQPHRALHSFTK